MEELDQASAEISQNLIAWEKMNVTYVICFSRKCTNVSGKQSSASLLSTLRKLYSICAMKSGRSIEAKGNKPMSIWV